MSSETSAQRKRRLQEWQKNRNMALQKGAKTAKKTPMLRRSKRNRKENSHSLNSPAKTKIPTPATKRKRTNAKTRSSLGSQTVGEVAAAANNVFKVKDEDITELLRTKCKEKRWELKKTISFQKGLIKKLKRCLKDVSVEKDQFLQECVQIELGIANQSKELKTRQNSAEKERISLKLKLQELMKDQGEKMEQIARLTKARDESVNIRDELTQQLSTLQQQLNENKAQSAEHVAHIKKVEGSLKVADSKLKALQDEFEENKAKFLKSLEDTQNRLQAELVTAKTSAKNTENALNEKLEHEQKQKEVLTARANELELQKFDLEKTCKARELEIATLKMEVQHSKETLDRTHRNHENTKEQLRTKEDQLANALQSFSKNQQSHQNRVEKLLEAQTKLEDENQEYRSSTNSLNRELHELKQTLSVSETKLADTQSRLQTSETELSQKKIELENTQKNLMEIKEELSSTSSKLTETKTAFEHSEVQWNQQMTSERQAWEVAKNHLEEMLNTRTQEFEDTKSELETTKTKLASSESEKAEVQVLLREKQIEVSTLKANVGASYEAQMKKLVEMASEKEALSRKLSSHGILQTSYNDLLQKCQDMQRQLLENEHVRRKLHNRIQELRGNIRVFVRVRPFLPSDGVDDVGAQPIKFASDQQSLKVVTEANTQKFKFDKIFDMDSTQANVFGEVSELVQSALDGHNVCIFSYGQTGSGKTYSMQGIGNGDQEGLIPRSIKQILATASKLRAQGWEFHLDASFLEIYNEKINDLLTTFKGAKCPESTKLNRAGFDVKKNRKGETYVSNLKLFRVNSMDEVERLIEHATKARSVGCTAMNAQSSRSHSVFTLQVTGINKLETKQLRGALHLCDLAGSERLVRSQAKGAALKETQNINKSLSFLANVFMQIKRKNSHISFRDTKLTYLLEPCFSKNGKTMMLVNVSPTLESTQETLCSLKFASQVNQVELGQAKAKVSKLENTKSESASSKSRRSVSARPKKRSVRKSVISTQRKKTRR